MMRHADACGRVIVVVVVTVTRNCMLLLSSACCRLAQPPGTGGEKVCLGCLALFGSLCRVGAALFSLFSSSSLTRPIKQVPSPPL
jgi:hypothetical protein